MKKLTSILIVVMFIAFSNNLSAQFSFSVSPGFNLNGASFGYKINKVVPYIGFQYFSAGYSVSETGKRVNYTTNQIEDYTDELTMSGGLIIPNIGVKYFFLSRNDINAYGNILISKPIIYGKSTEDGDPNDDFNNKIKNTNFLAGGLGFGVEYNFSENFSIGGEFGIRYFTGNYSESEDRTINDPNTGDPITYKKEIRGNANFSPTYTKITLNYYFGKKKKE